MISDKHKFSLVAPFNKRRNAAILLLIFIGISVGLTLGFYSPLTHEDLIGGGHFFGSKKDSDQVIYWQDQIQEFGAKEAYKRLKDTLETNMSNGKKHIYAHYFGEALYKTLGVEGVFVCDGDLTFGCYHSFFGFAITDKGLDVLAEMDKKCLAVYGTTTASCQHGLGHGVISELGQDNLNDALFVCSRLSTEFSAESCTGGVFMEYNFNTMTETNIRQPKNNDYHFPCTKVPEEFVKSCYQEQPFWWIILSHKDFGFVGKKCLEVSDPNLMNLCYERVGQFMLGVLGYSDTEVESACSLMGDTKAVSLCRNSALDTLSKQQGITP